MNVGDQKSRCSEQGAVRGADHQTLKSAVLRGAQQRLAAFYPGAALTKALFNTFCRHFADVIDRVISSLLGVNPIPLSNIWALCLPAQHTVTPHTELIQNLAQERDERLYLCHWLELIPPTMTLHVPERLCCRNLGRKWDFPHFSAKQKAQKSVCNF